MKILEIRLLTNRLNHLEDFYHDLFGLPMTNGSETSVSFPIGSSTLTFEHSDQVVDPVYHFAFNVSENKMQMAIDWLKAKGITINLIDDYSESWNSDSVYFYDPSGNIVEFIARHNLKSDVVGGFSIVDLLSISEIGLTAASDVSQLSAYLQEQWGQPIYRSGSSTFMPIGDEQGMFILASLNRTWLGSDKKSNIFPLNITIQNEAEETRQVPGYPYTITTRP